MPFDLIQAMREQSKALPAHPVLQDRSVPVSIYQAGPGSSGRKDSLISQREAMRHSDAYGGSQAMDWVYDCVNLYADAASTADYRLEDEDGTKLVRAKTPGTPPEYKLGPKTLYDLLDKPNPFMLYDELVSLLVIDLMLVGNGYWFKWQVNSEGRPLALYRLSPSYVKIAPNQYGPGYYEYQPPGAKKPLKIDPEFMIHFRRPNPHSAFLGMGVIQGGGRAMDLELAVTDTITSYYENKADPSLIVQSDRRVPRDVFKKLHAQLRARTAGPDRAGELLVLEQGLKASSLSASASDAMFQELAGMSRDRIYSKFRAAPELFGQTAKNSGSNTVSEHRREFDNSALRPFLKRLSAKITTELAAAWGVKYIIDHRSYLPSEEAIKVADSFAAVPGAKIREVRRLYEQFGIEESTGDEAIDNFVLNKPQPEADANGNVVDPLTGKVVASAAANGGAGAGTRAIGSQPGRPLKAQTGTGFGTTKPKPSGKSVEESIKESLAALEAKALSSNPLDAEVGPPDTFASARAADLSDASALMRAELADAAHVLERELLDIAEGKALKTSDIVGRIRNAEAWKTFRASVQSALRNGIARAASSGVMHSGLTPDEDIDYEALADEVLNRKEGLPSIVKTLKDRAARRVKEARDANGERHDYNAAISEVISEWTTGQAETIANTEAVHGYNEATLQAAELSGVTQVYVTDGDDHDEPCQEANGSVWDIAHARENRLEHPNCYRAFLPLTTEAVA